MVTRDLSHKIEHINNRKWFVGFRKNLKNAYSIIASGDSCTMFSFVINDRLVIPYEVMIALPDLYGFIPIVDIQTKLFYSGLSFNKLLVVGDTIQFNNIMLYQKVSDKFNVIKIIIRDGYITGAVYKSELKNADKGTRYCSQDIRQINRDFRSATALSDDLIVRDMNKRYSFNSELRINP
jgi:hypothetical protein